MSPLVGLALEIVMPLISDVLGSGKEAETLKNKIKLKALEVDDTLIKSKAQVLLGEIHGTKLQRSWRPHLMYFLMGLMLWIIAIVPILNSMIMPGLESFMCWVAGAETCEIFKGKLDVSKALKNVPDQLWTMFSVALTGYIGGRSIEKVAGPLITEYVKRKQERPAQYRAPAQAKNHQVNDMPDILLTEVQYRESD